MVPPVPRALPVAPDQTEWQRCGLDRHRPPQRSNASHEGSSAVFQWGLTPLQNGQCGLKHFGARSAIMPRIQLRLTPRGHLLLEEANDASALDGTVAARLARAFARGSGYGLLQLGAGEIGRSLPPALNWWRDFAGRY